MWVGSAALVAGLPAMLILACGVAFATAPREPRAAARLTHRVAARRAPARRVSPLPRGAHPARIRSDSPPPILVVTGSGDSFGAYCGEILTAEGLNLFTIASLADLTPDRLAGVTLVLLGQTPLTSDQAALLGNWVQAGGKLIASRPDPQLAGLLGLEGPSGTLDNAYLKVDASTPPGAGITDQSMQYHGTADLYALDGASAVATLYSDASTPTTSPAVTLCPVGGAGGAAAAFCYDLARSVVYTRQGNPAWAWQERDGVGPLRPDDMFFGAAVSDPEPDWVDLSRVAIPQADEQQRLLANLITTMCADRLPVPRFWYFPRGLKAVVVMTGDDHAHGGTAGRFAHYLALSPPGCSLPDWECIRSTSYIFPGTPFTIQDDSTYVARGFEVGVHLNTLCNTVTGPALDALWTSQLFSLSLQLPNNPPIVTNRNHCVEWGGWVTTAQIERQHGIRLDTGYYYWPPQWVQNRPGMFTGSGIPMHFADLDGSLVDVYQVTTQMTDESAQTYPFTINSLLDRALGPQGYYGAFCANMHTDLVTSTSSDAILSSAFQRGVPVISSVQLLTWLDGRNASSFQSLAWSGDSLAFTIGSNAGARGLTGMLPDTLPGLALAGLTSASAPVPFTLQAVKGIGYAFFPAQPGSYVAVYDSVARPPVVSGLAAQPQSDGRVLVRWTTSQACDTRLDYGLAPNSLTLSVRDPGLTTAHQVFLTQLVPTAPYWFRARSTNAVGIESDEPPADQDPASFTTPTHVCASDQGAPGFNAGVPDSDLAIAHDGPGGVILAPVAAAEFVSTALPPGWSAAPTDSGGVAVVAAGVLRLSGARFSADSAYDVGHQLEIAGTVPEAPLELAGFGGPSGAFAGFATDSSGQLMGLVTDGADSAMVAIDADLGIFHRFAVHWDPDSVRLTIDDAPVASLGPLTGPLHPIAASLVASNPPLMLQWMRLSPFAAQGAFLSRILDAGNTTMWKQFSWGADIPDETELGLEVRTGSTPDPDGTWTPFQAIPASGAVVGAGSRYLQYRATLSSSNPGRTPELRAIAVGCDLPVSVAASVPARTRLAPAAPNPSAGPTLVAYAVGRDAASGDAAPVRVSILDLAGREVRIVRDGPQAPGEYRVLWDGADQRGRAVAPGVYLVRLTAARLGFTRKIAVVR